MVDLNGHEAGNGGHSQGKPTAYRDSSTRRDVVSLPAETLHPMTQLEVAYRYGNPCTSDADCDSGTLCREWQDGTKNCEDPILTPVDPQIVGILQPCQTDADCPSDNECSWLGGNAGEVKTHGNCIGRQLPNPVITPK